MTNIRRMAVEEGSQPIRVGVVGTGFAAASHLDALSRVPGLDVGLVGSSVERARAAARRFGVRRVYPDLDALLSDAGVHAIHNCTPNDVHADITLRGLAAGKHVLSEKPLALNSRESSELVKASKERGSVTGVCFNYRHFPLVQQIRAMLAAGRDGAVHLVHGSYLQDWLLYDDDWNWRLQSPRAGSTRAVADIGSHWVDTVEHMTGDSVTAVMADLGRLHEERRRPEGETETFAGRQAGGIRYRVDTEDFASVLVRFASGARGSFVVSQVAPGRRNRLWFEIDAASASFVWDQEEPNRLWIGRRGRPNRDLVRDPSLLEEAAAGLARYPGGHQEGWPDAMRNLMSDFYGAVAARRNGASYRPTFASFEEAHHVMHVIEAVARSAEVGAWVDVDGEANVRDVRTTKEVEE
jgi:predicted dehydrogenase